MAGIKKIHMWRMLTICSQHTIYGFLASAAITKLCKEAGLPINIVWVPYETHTIWAALQVNVAALRAQKWERKAFCKRVGEVVFGSHAASAVSRLLLVGDDIDPTDFDDVLWAFATRCRPGQDEYIFEDTPGFILMPFMAHGPGNPVKGGKVVADCLFIEQWTQPDFEFTEASFRGGYPEQVRTLVNEGWKEKYGLGQKD